MVYGGKCKQHTSAYSFPNIHNAQFTCMIFLQVHSGSVR